MPWVRVDDAFYDHQRWCDASPAEVGIWLIALAWSNRNLRDGRVPKVVLHRLVPSHEGDIEALISRGAFDEGDGDCYVIHDYLEWQKSAEEIRELSKKRAEAGQRGGNASATAKQVASNSQIKSQPQPQPQPTSSRSTKPPVDYSPTDEQCTWAQAHGLNVQEQLERWLAWCEANGRMYKSVGAGFTTWLHRAADGKPQQAAPSRIERPPERQICKRCSNTGNYFKAGVLTECKVHEYR